MRSMRSRTVRCPFACLRSTRSTPPSWRAAARRRSSSASPSFQLNDIFSSSCWDLLAVERARPVFLGKAVLLDDAGADAANEQLRGDHLDETRYGVARQGTLAGGEERLRVERGAGLQGDEDLDLVLAAELVDHADRGALGDALELADRRLQLVGRHVLAAAAEAVGQAAAVEEEAI